MAREGDRHHVSSPAPGSEHGAWPGPGRSGSLDGFEALSQSSFSSLSPASSSHGNLEMGFQGCISEFFRPQRFALIKKLLGPWGDHES